MIIRRFKTILTVFSPVPLAEPTACCVAVSGEGLVRSSRLLTSSVILAGGQQRALAVWYQTGFSFFFFILVALHFNFCNFIDVTVCRYIARSL